jgi:hypothetical protein
MSRAERRDALLARVFEENPGITSAADLRDFANEAEEDEENPVNPTFKEVKAFLGGQGRSQVHKEVKQEWPGQLVYKIPQIWARPFAVLFLRKSLK